MSGASGSFWNLRQRELSEDEEIVALRRRVAQLEAEILKQQMDAPLASELSIRRFEPPEFSFLGAEAATFGVKASGVRFFFCHGVSFWGDFLLLGSHYFY